MEKLRNLSERFRSFFGVFSEFFSLKDVGTKNMRLAILAYSIVTMLHLSMGITKSIDGYDVTIESYDFTKADHPLRYPSCLIVSWRKEGKLHRDNAPAQIIRDLATDEIIRTEYYKNGKLHRDNGPASITETGEIKCVEHFIAGKISSPNGEPFRTDTCKKTGVITGMAWAKDGQLSRDNGPVSFARDPETGVITHENYMVDGQMHRKDGPARIHREASTGIADVEEYFLKGVRHRNTTDGPAVIIRNSSTGEITRTEYYQNGQELQIDGLQFDIP